MNAEEVKIGCFQVVLALLLGVNYVIVAMSHALPIFHNYTPKFYCEERNTTNRTFGCQNLKNVTVGANLTHSFLDMPQSGLCSSEYQFQTEYGESSVVTEWKLICERRYLTFLGPTIYYVGVLLGACIAGILTDRIGRLPVQAICLYTQGTMAVTLYVVQSYPTFLALRGLQGVFVQGLQNSTYILSLELFPAKARTFVALVMQISWAFGLILLALLSYFIPDWRILQLAVSVPTAITVLYIWILPESPRWLLAKGKATEADMAIERIAKYNACCCKPRKEISAKSEECFKENITPLKPERKSRATSVDLKKAKSGDETKTEATNLLTETVIEQQKVQKTSLKQITEATQKILSSGETTTGIRQSENAETEKRATPSSSKCHRKSKSISQSVCSKRISMKNDQDMVELKTTPKSDGAKEKKAKIRHNGDKSPDKSNDQNLKKLLENPVLRKYSLVMIFQWLSTCMAYSIFEILVPDFTINRHVTFALSGALEIATYVFIYFVLSRYGRRLPMFIYQFSNGVICILVAAFIVLLDPTVFWIDLIKTIVLLLGRVTVTSTVFIAYLYTVEIFPTVVRGTCLGLCAVFAKIGSLTTPHVLLSGEYVPVAVPLIIVGMLCLVSGSLAVILPETLNKILPDTIEDSEGLIVVIRKRDSKNFNNEKNTTKEDLTERDILRDKLFSEDWVDAGNGILVNFSENKASN